MLLNIKKTIFILFLLIPLYSFSQKQDDSIKILINKLSKLQIQYLCDGEISKYLEIFSKNYTDLGGGNNRDGTVDFKAWKNKLKKLITSKKYKKIKGKKATKILDSKKQTIWNYKELLREKGEIKRFSYTSKEGDYIVLLPLKEKIPLSFWFGIFRIEDGKWKIIAGN